MFAKHFSPKKSSQRVCAANGNTQTRGDGVEKLPPQRLCNEEAAETGTAQPENMIPLGTAIL
jgi:hypothetical protein